MSLPSAPSRKRSAPRSARRALVAAGLAVALHLVFGALVVLLSLVDPSPTALTRLPPRPVTVRPLSADQWARNRGEQSAQAPRPPEPRKPKVEERPEGQIVDVAPGNNERAPDAKYVAETNNRVQKETRAREQTANYRNAMPQRTSNAPKEGQGQDVAEKPQIAGNLGTGMDDRPLRAGAESKAVMEVPNVRRRDQVALKHDPSEGPGSPVTNRSESMEVAGNSQRLRIQPGGEGDTEASAGKRGEPGVVNLTPSASVLDKIAGAAPNDHLKDVDEGAGTFLNTKEWKHSSFFNRVKQSVGMHWNPSEGLRQRDPTGTIYGGRDRYTVLQVKLDPTGRVKDVWVEKSSGLDFLDLEAIQSFERAQPFPNPPPGLITGDSTVQFSFGFFLDMGGGPRMRLFRRPN